MPYIGPLNTSEGARKSDFDFDYLSQHPTSSAVIVHCGALSIFVLLNQIVAQGKNMKMYFCGKTEIEDDRTKHWQE